MDASDSVYYPFPDNGHIPGNDPRHCSVRGCTQLVTNGSQNKMCDACRGRHRIYASTKRARRKLEKAAVAARNGQEPLDPVQNGISSPIVTASSWMSGNADTFHEEIASPNPHSSVSGPSSSISPFLSASWNQAIDPRLFAQDTLTSPSLRLHLHRTSSSSELANALTLPPPRPRIQAESVSDENRDPEEHKEEDKECKCTQASGDAAAKDLGEGPTRLCSVKGCKSVLPPSYEFKMCSPCRDRYRTYGTTKRAKWKTERDAFDREMAGLRALEDKKRELEGLSPLADNPDELRAWELSIIDEQIPAPDAVATPMASLASPVDSPQQLASEPLFSVGYTSPMVMAGVYPATIGSIDTPHSISPYPHLSDPLHMPAPGPLPARMCTVSHCHKILPGYYRYKRCEQHRLQNRHHSKLKRVREKGSKDLGPGEEAAISEGVSTSSIVACEVDDSVASDEDAKILKAKNDKKGRGKAIEESSSINPEGPSLGDSTTMPLWPCITIPKPDINRIGPEPKSRAKMQQLSKFSCATDDCENLLTPGIRWRTCEECRDRDRLRKFTVRAELKAAENAYWKGVAQSLSAARKANEMAGNSETSPEVVVSDQKDAPVIPSPTGGDEDDDAYGDSDVADEEEGALVPAPPPILASASASTTDSSLVPSTASPPARSIVTIPALIPAATTPETSSLVSVPTPTPSVVGNPSMDNLNTTIKIQAYYRKERMELQPPMHLSPTFNSLTKQQRAQADSVPVVNGQFSKFRVQLVPGSSAPPPMQTTAPVWDSQPVPLASPAAADDIHALVDVVKATTETQIAKDSSSDLGKTGPTSESAAEVNKEMPTLTIPTSAPFVYNAPVKNPAKETKTTTSNAKGKKSGSKTAGPKRGMAASVTAAISISGPPNPFPYGFPPSYPYYPYYMPPFPYPPLPPALPFPSNNKGASQPPASTSTAPTPGAPNFYPYPSQHYGLGVPPDGYPYLPPRYTLPGYNSIPGQQPYPVLPPPTGPYKGYPYFIPTPGASSSAPPPTATVSTATASPSASPSASHDSQPTQPLPKPTTKPLEFEVAKFTYHHLGTDSFSAIPDKPTRKRRKVDPDYLEKHKALQAERLALMTNAVSPVPLIPFPEASVEQVPAGSPTEGLERTTDSESEPNEGQSNGMVSRPCATKTCRRTIPTDTVGKICEKCKLRLKKHQAKTKRKFKLEPRKFFLAQDIQGVQDQAEAVTNETEQILLP